MPDPNLEMLRIAVKRLGALTDDLVFVGGCTIGLLITDDGAAEIRATDDVDSIVEATSYVEYLKFSERLQDAGFKIDTREDAPLCRWVNGDTVLDVMPLDEETLGFTNSWYRPAVKTAELHEVLPGTTIKVVNPVYFCATKLEAFYGRGEGDYLASHDIEDLVTVIDGRGEIVNEIREAEEAVRAYIAGEIGNLLGDRGFRDAVPGHLLPDAASQQRLPLLFDRLTHISDLK